MRIRAIAAVLFSLTVAAMWGPPTRAAEWQEGPRCFENIPTQSVEELILHCTAFIDSHPKSSGSLALALHSRGIAWMLKGDPDRAIQDFDEALRLNPKDPIDYINRARAWISKGDLDRAMTDYDQSIRLNPRASYIYLGRGELWERKGDYPRALADMDRAVGIEPSHFRTLNASCWVRAVLGSELNRALAECDKAARLSSNVAGVYDSRAFVHLRRSEYALAVADADKALALKPELAASLFVRGVARLRLGREGEGRADIDAASKLEPKILERYAAWGVKP